MSYLMKGRSDVSGLGRLFCVVSIALIAGVVGAAEPLRFADVFTDNMVLQRGRDIKCWGWAEPGSEVEVILTQSVADAAAFAGSNLLEKAEDRVGGGRQNPAVGKVRLGYIEEDPAAFMPVSKKVVAGKEGRWEVDLGTYEASFTPAFLAARTENDRILIKNLLIGEVWITSGQSNMEWAWTRDKMWENKGLTFNAVRYAKVRGASAEPSETFTKGKGAFEPWIVCEDGAVDRVATIPYLFAQYLHRRLKVPVGIINIAQGGSFAREWCSREVLVAMASLTVDAQLASYDLELRQKNTEDWRSAPAELYNGRLFPIRRMTVAGVIYLQGENEALSGDLPQYFKTFPGVIKTYRDALSRPDLPFGIITLQGFGTRETSMNESAYATARAIHWDVHTRTPGTGYIAAHDVGGGIHPDWKRPLAERAVYWALRDVYKVVDEAERTRIKQATFKVGKAFVEFESTTLKGGEWGDPKVVMPPVNNQQPFAGFLIAGTNQVWYPGRIEENDRSPGLLIFHPLVPEPVAVRYAWDGYSPGNLGSWQDPVPPYRSDCWPLTMEDRVVDAAAGEQSEAAAQYLEAHRLRNLMLEADLKIAVADSIVNLTKRHAHPKGILIDTVENMQALMKNADLKPYVELSPELRQRALYNIACRYWGARDKFIPERIAKWGWLMERVILLDRLPAAMEQELGRPAIAEKLKTLANDLVELRRELEKLPDPEPMPGDAMLDCVFKVMELETQKLENEGVDLKGKKEVLTRNPF